MTATSTPKRAAKALIPSIQALPMRVHVIHVGLTSWCISAWSVPSSCSINMVNVIDSSMRIHSSFPI